MFGIETRAELVEKSRDLPWRVGFSRMSLLNLSVAESIASPLLPPQVDIVTALHACDTATDDAIRFALAKRARFIVLVPCCQAEVATALRRHKNESLARGALAEIWRPPIHTREFGSHVTNVLRCLLLEAHGCQLTVTELVELGTFDEERADHRPPRRRARGNARERLGRILQELNLDDLRERSVAPDVPLGNHLLRIRTKSGISHMRQFFVGPFPNADEKEPNSEMDAAQVIQFNRTIEGVVLNEDVDYYKITAKKGQRISVEADGLRLGYTTFDPYIAIIDKDRFEKSFSDDTILHRQDGYCSFVAEYDGDYYIMIRESSYRGGGNNYYRLHVGSYRRPDVVYPAGGKIGSKTNVRFIRLGPFEGLQQKVGFDANGDAQRVAYFMMVKDGRFVRD